MARTSLVSTSVRNAQQRGRDQAETTAATVKATTLDDRQNRQDYAGSGLPPDWLTSGIAGAGMGWLFGPVGGLVGAAVTTILSKRRRTGIATAAAADAETGQTLIEGGDRALKRLETTAETDEERLEVALLRDRYDQAVALTLHPDPSVSVNGFQGLMAIPGLVESEADEIEEERIAADARTREKLETEVAQLGSLASQYRQDSARFVDVRTLYAEVVSAFGEPNGAGDIRGMYTFLKMLDPDSTIMPGELALADNTGGISELVRSQYNELLNGQLFTPTIRKNFENEAREAFENSQQAQRQIDTRYMDRGRASDIRPSLLSTLTVNTDPLDAASYRAPDPYGRVPANNLPPGAQVVNADGSVSAVIDYWSQFGKEVETDLSESTFAYDGEANQWYETTKMGTVFMLPAPPPGIEPPRTQRDDPDLDPDDLRNVEIEGIFSPAAEATRRAEDQARIDRAPGLFQRGGFFGRDLTAEEEARRQQLLNRPRPTN